MNLGYFLFMPPSLEFELVYYVRDWFPPRGCPSGCKKGEFHISFVLGLNIYYEWFLNSSYFDFVPDPRFGPLLMTNPFLWDLGLLNELDTWSLIGIIGFGPLSWSTGIIFYWAINLRLSMTIFAFSWDWASLADSLPILLLFLSEMVEMSF